MHIIAGMHRSGTSLVARLFYEAGADMGSAGDFYPADKWNTGGYFEQTDIHNINMPLINGPWWKFAYFWLPSTETIMKRAERFAEKIRTASAKYRGKVVKENRFCLTLPAWLKYGGAIEKILVCLRDPLDVARSLKNRNHIPLAYALKLWHVHMTRLLEHAKDIPLWFVYYNNLLDEKCFVQEMKPAFHFFEYTLTDDEVKALGEKCVRPQVNKNPLKSVHYSRDIEVLWNDVLKRHEDQGNTVSRAHQGNV